MCTIATRTSRILVEVARIVPNLVLKASADLVAAFHASKAFVVDVDVLQGFRELLRLSVARSHVGLRCCFHPAMPQVQDQVPLGLFVWERVPGHR